MVVANYSPVAGRSERIVVPRDFVKGLLECLHLKLQHPSKLQLRKVFVRAYYALDLDEYLDVVAKRCHTCLALSDMPNKFLQQSMTTYPSAIGSNFASDIIKRSGQLILIVREYVSSYTVAKLITDEKSSTLRTALMVLCSEIIPQSGPVTTVKVDPASSCRSLVSDKEVKRCGISLELGEAKFVNKNPVAERAIREVHAELNRVLEGASDSSEIDLVRAIANLNGRIRGEGLSSREVWMMRDQFSGEQLPINDMALIKSQEQRKKKGHEPSASYKARGKAPSTFSPVVRGDIVYLNSDRDKTCQRQRYIVLEVFKESCKVQTFVEMQLRARPYTVHRADVLMIEPWMFKEEDHQDEDSDNEGILRRDEEIITGDPQHDHDDMGDEVDETAADHEVETVTDDPDDNTEQDGRIKEVVTRYGRQVRTPNKFADYVLE